MTWEDYYDKVYEWKTSTAVSRLSSLEDFGDPEEVLEIIIHIAFDNETGANRLLKKATAYGVKFTGEQLAELAGTCSDELVKVAIMQSASEFTKEDLDNLYCCVEDELIVEVAKKFHIDVPEDIKDEYAEVVKTTSPLSWKRFYEAYEGWSEAYAKSRLNSLTDFGKNEKEIIEVVDNLFCVDKAGASKFINHVMDAGFYFSEFGVLEISALCNKQTTTRAYKLLKKPVSENTLEDLYGMVDEVDLLFDVRQAIDSADYAIECLICAQKAIKQVKKGSVINTLLRKFVGLHSKSIVVNKGDYELAIAKMAVASLNDDLKVLGRSQVVDLIDIDKSRDVQKQIKKAIERARDIRKELEKVK